MFRFLLFGSSGSGSRCRGLGFSQALSLERELKFKLVINDDIIGQLFKEGSGAELYAVERTINHGFAVDHQRVAGLACGNRNLNWFGNAADGQIAGQSELARLAPGQDASQAKGGSRVFDDREEIVAL